VWVLGKGVYEDVEEYSIFKNQISSDIIKKIVETERIERIDLCGIAGDICVLNTLKDGKEIYGSEMFHVLTEFSASLDGGKALNEEISAHLSKW
jgi:nicotinamidase/pyrazinamidase